MHKKPLYLAKNLGDLVKDVDRSLGQPTLMILRKTSDKIYNRIKLVKRTNPLDEEFLYVLSLRYLKLVESIRVAENDDKFWATMFSASVSTVEQIKATCEQSLTARYGKTQPLELDEPILKQQTTSKCTDLFISTEMLFIMISDTPADLLIIDTRSAEQCQQSRIKHENIINIPDSIITRGLTTNLLRSRLAEEYRDTFQDRYKYQYIVLLDISTTKVSYPHSKLSDLRSILIEWDMQENLVNPPVILDGGIKQWTDSYPTYVTNPGDVYNQQYKIFDDLFEEIFYPDDEPEIPMPPLPTILNFEATEQPSDVVQPREDQHEVYPEEDAAMSQVLRPTSDLPDQLHPKEGNASIEGVNLTDEFKIGTILQDILNVAETQIKAENKLLDLAQTCLNIKKQIITRGRTSESDYMELRTLEIKISKHSSFRIESNERRQILDKLYMENRTEGDELLLQEMLDGLKSLDKKRLLKYQQRKIIEQEEEYLKEKLMDIGFNNSWQPSISPVRPLRPEVPDRRKKPTDQTVYSVIADLKNHYKGDGFIGLCNIRNTCYMNSLIQCLRFCPPFLHEITLKSYKSCEDTEVVKHLIGLIKTMWNETRTGTALKPSNLYNEICKADNYECGYVNGSHEDIQEFYLFLMKVLHSEVAETKLVNKEEAPGKLSDWCAMFKYKLSFVTDHFYHQLEHSLSCDSCGKLIVRYDYGNTVFVNVLPENPLINIGEQLKDYLKIYPEDLGRACTRCEKDFIVSKRISYHPTILTVNIARYSFDRDEGCILRKDNECYLQDTVYFGSCRYKLHAVSLHSGNRDVGHYTALCYHPFKQKWVEFNDDRCRLVDHNHPRYRSQCYMLFYILQHNPSEVNQGFFIPANQKGSRSGDYK